MPRNPNRVCSQPGCVTISPATRCPLHARPTTARRGYNHQHRKTRRQWALLVEAGQVNCFRCGEWIAPGEPWDLGHDDEDRTITHGPEHRDRCNRSAAGHASHHT